MKDMDDVIDRVARLVENALNEVVGMIDAGRVRLETALKQFGTSDAAIAQEVAGDLREQFSALEKSVDEKQAEIVNSLAERYVAAQKEVQSTIDTLRDPVGALIDIAVDAVSGVIDTILKMKDLLTSALAKAGGAIDLILADPIAFLGHLVAGVKQGVMGFLSNIGTYLQKGLLDWLFGALAQAGIQMPDTFDLSGLMSIVLQVLGLTWTNIRQRAVAIVGEPVVQTLETGSEIIKTLITKGAAGLWDYIKEQASALMETVKEGVKSFIMESVIVAGVKWLIGLLNPASAFVKACMAIYDIVTFMINKGQQILEFVNAVLDSVLAIAQGNVAPAAKAVESALARSIPVAIGFLASLLGVGDLGGKIKKVIDKIQAPVNKVIDWLIKKAVALVKAIGKALGIGPRDDVNTSEKATKFTDADPVDMSGHGHEVVTDVDGDSVTLGLASSTKRDILGLITQLKHKIRSSTHLNKSDKEKRLKRAETLRIRTKHAIASIRKAVREHRKKDAALQDPVKRAAIRKLLLNELITDIRELAKEWGIEDLEVNESQDDGDSRTIFWDLGLKARGLLGEAYRGGNRKNPNAPVMDRHEKGGGWESHKTMGGESYEDENRILSTGRRYIVKASTFSKEKRIKGERRDVRERRLVLMIQSQLKDSLVKLTAVEIEEQLKDFGNTLQPTVVVIVKWM